MKKVCVYCGSRPGMNPLYRKTASKVGEIFAKNGYGLVYGGGKVGLMGVIADSVLEHNGFTEGVIPKSLMEREIGHSGITKLHITQDMHTRKAMMESLSDAFLILPGGFGTLDEMFEIITWKQLGFHKKPIILMNVNGFFDPLLQFIKKAVSENYILEKNGELLQVVSTTEELLRKLNASFS